MLESVGLILGFFAGGGASAEAIRGMPAYLATGIIGFLSSACWSPELALLESMVAAATKLNTLCYRPMIYTLYIV